ncbi:MAG: acyl-CoA dehydratase activase, partial [Pseudomonadota bacterium]
LWPPARCVLDVGAQKCVAVKCLGGKPLKIRANDRCASGSGRYIEMVADVLGVPLEKLGDAVLRADGCVEVKSTCTVFAESEVITLIHSKEKPEHIIKGAHRALAQRAYTLLLHVDWEEDLCLVGGLGKNKGFVKELEALVGCPVSIPHLADFTAAIGAAIICQENGEVIS